MLKINQLTKQFGSFVAVNKVSLEINEPGLYIFVGSNGSGKTTLFNLINGFALPNSGEIIFNANPVNNKIEKPVVGISSEPFDTEPSLTVLEIAEICRQIKRVQATEIEYWLSIWELQPVYYKKFKILSTGMKKRLGLALSLFGNPEFLFWDEPFSGIDPLGIEILNQMISRLLQQGKYIFLTTHLLNEISAKQASYFVMRDGKIVAVVNKNTENSKATVLNLLKKN